ncbi:recombinase [Clostridia bacterium]|nr:recombinase [Clostridia bacterium]
MVLAVTYARLSDPDERDGDSVLIENQRSMLRAYCKENGLKIVGEYEDDGKSSFKLRPAFEKMVSDLRNGKAQVVVCKDGKRFTRDSVDRLLYQMRILPELGVELRFTNPTMDSQFLELEAWINKRHSYETSKTIRDAFKQMRKEGKYCTARVPWGYKKVGYKLYPEEPAASVVRQVYAWAFDGMPINAISVKLQEMGIKTTQGNDYWWQPRIVQMLQNRAYRGDLYLGHTKPNPRTKVSFDIPDPTPTLIEGTHEAIVSPDLWDAVNRRLSAKKRWGNTTFNPYVGMIICGTCGRKHTMRSARSGSYVCNGYKRGNIPCTAHTVSKTDLDRKVLEEINKWIAENANIDQLFKDLSPIYQDNEITKDEIQAKIAASKKRLKKYVDMNLDERITDDEFNEYSKPIRAEIASFEDQAKRIADCDRLMVEWHYKIGKLQRSIAKYTEPQTEVTPELLSLVDHIVVYEREKPKSCKSKPRIEVFPAL